MLNCSKTKVGTFVYFFSKTKIQKPPGETSEKTIIYPAKSISLYDRSMPFDVKLWSPSNYTHNLYFGLYDKTQHGL